MKGSKALALVSWDMLGRKFDRHLPVASGGVISKHDFGILGAKGLYVEHGPAMTDMF